MPCDVSGMSRDVLGNEGLSVHTMDSWDVSEYPRTSQEVKDYQYVFWTSQDMKMSWRYLDIPGNERVLVHKMDSWDI